MKETQRIRNVYAKRDAVGKRRWYSLFNPAALFADHRREVEIIQMLSYAGVRDLSNVHILDLGCGNGAILRNFIRYGAQPQNCFGVDLLESRITEARHISPNMDFRCGNAESLSYSDGQFDMLLCFTVFTSILDGAMKQNITGEMLRVLKPGGIIIWYDYHLNNPKNTDVRGVKKKEIFKLFSGCDIKLRRTTLAPPITRALAPHSWTVCFFLEKMKIMNTHYIGIVKKPHSSV